MAFKNLGNQDGFLKYIEKVVSIKPDWGDAQLHLSRVKKFKKNDPKIIEIQTFLERDDLDIDDRIGLNFALAHIFENHENYDDQFRFLNEGNRLQKKELYYSFDIDKNRFSIIKKIFKNSSFNLEKIIGDNEKDIEKKFVNSSSVFPKEQVNDVIKHFKNYRKGGRALLLGERIFNTEITENIFNIKL